MTRTKTFAAAAKASSNSRTTVGQKAKIVPIGFRAHTCKKEKKNAKQIKEDGAKTSFACGHHDGPIVHIGMGKCVDANFGKKFTNI